ncbi:MAG: hypothetical protein JW763_01850 [candidate division Zixibacteria bacterium]|nr:hypothetical protein [candidate division Zixibacteria bacterium]
MTDRMATADKKILAGIATLAVIVRVLVAIFTDNLDHPDENFQLLEQAHRIVFGYGLIPWEFRYAVRSWLTPGFIAGLLYPFKLPGLDNPNLYVPAIRAILGVLSVSMVLSAYHIGRKLVSVRTGLVAAFLCAIWYEMIYFGIRPLSEIWASACFLGAVALALKPIRVRHLIIAGILAALTAAIRLHYLPVVAVFMIVTCIGLERAQCRVFLISFIMVVLAVGLFEKLTLGGFYVSYISYFTINRSYSMNVAFGEGSTLDYLLYIGYASLFVFWLFFIGGIAVWKKAGGLILYILAVLLPHLALPIKAHLISVRFIFLTIPLFLIMGAVVISVLRENLNNQILKRYICTGFCAIMIIISIMGAYDALPGGKQVYAHNLFYTDPHLRAYRYLHDEQSIAGVYDNASFWFQSGGYYYLHRDIPLYYPNTPPASPDFISHAVTTTDFPGAVGFERIATFGDIAVHGRSDPHFVYRHDSEYSRDMFQAGVDDKINHR